MLIYVAVLIMYEAKRGSERNEISQKAVPTIAYRRNKACQNTWDLELLLNISLNRLSVGLVMNFFFHIGDEFLNDI